ncbi:MAG: hypothetical protein J4F37_14140, partial [Acidobacteria bacterium]|nr:hypothetical protein [Acidobacteriota bacterium]
PARAEAPTGAIRPERSRAAAPEEQPEGGPAMSQLSAYPQAGSVEDRLNDLLIRLEAVPREGTDDDVLRVLDGVEVPSADDGEIMVPVVNKALYADIAAHSEHVYPLVNGYVVFRDPDSGGRFTAYAADAFLEAVQPDGRLAGRAGFGPGLADRLADYGGAYLPVLGEIFAEELQDIRRDVEDIAGAMNPHVRVEVTERLFGGGQALLRSGAHSPDRQPAAGLYFRMHGMAAVSMDLSRNDPLETVYHELFHSIAPLLDDEEKERLGRAFGGGTKAAASERMAEGFANYAAALRRGERPPSPAGGAADSAFGKLWQFVGRMNNALAGRGWRSAEDVRLARLVGRIAGGEVAARARVFDAAASITVEEAVGIARAAGAERLAQTVEGYGKRLHPDGKKAVIRGAALYRALRQSAGLDDRSIREALREYGYQEISDPQRLTALTADVEADRRAALAAATKITPRTASETLPAMARLGLRSLAGGAAAEDVGAPEREIWHLSRESFMDAARTAKSAANGQPTELVFEGVAGAARLAHEEDRFTSRWSFGHTRFPVTVDGKDAKSWEEAAGAVHYHQVKEALGRGDFVPNRVIADYEDLCRDYPARLVDDPRLVRRPTGAPVPRPAGPMVARMGARLLGSGARFSLAPDSADAARLRGLAAQAFDPARLEARGFDVARPGWTAVPDPRRPSVETGGTTIFDDEMAARRLIGADIAPVYVAGGREADLSRP